MTTIIANVLSIFLIMGVGFAAGKTNVIPQSADKYFVSLLMNITMPCMVITSITSKEFNADLGMATVEIFVLGALFFVFTFAAGWLVCKKLLHVSPASDLGVYVFCFSSINNGFMGFPITQAVFGSDILYFVVLHNIMLNLYMFSAGPFVLSMGAGTRHELSLRYIGKKLCNPTMIVSTLSVIMLLCGLKLPALAFDTLELIGSITVPLSMILVGVQLSGSNVARIIKNRHLFICSLIKMAAVPVLLFLAVNWLPIATGVKVALIFGGAFPAAVITAAIAEEEGRNYLLAAEIVALTTLLSVAVIPAASVFLTSYYSL